MIFLGHSALAYAQPLVINVLCMYLYITLCRRIHVLLRSEVRKHASAERAAVKLVNLLPLTF